jgi:membrane-bound lytic murein transglycosylase D
MIGRPQFAVLCLTGIVAWGCSAAPKKAYVPLGSHTPPVAREIAVSSPAARVAVTPNFNEIPQQPKFDPVLDVIQSAEAAFERGRKSYDAGHLETAKSEFNIAVNTLLQAPITPREDRRLMSTFESLVQRIHEYEMAALRAGDGFAEPGFTPALIDELQALNVKDDLREPTVLAGANKAPSRTNLPLVINSQVAGYIEYFSNGRGRATLMNAMQRSGRFRDMIYRVLDEERVPRELIFLAQAESGFQPRALSNKAAMGMWQFISGTGKLYGLERSWWEDDRLNPEEATRAAARHLGDLYDSLGDWYLAMAAYNCGEFCVSRAVERTGYADFWELSRRNALPKETRNYVPLILALTIVGSNPEKYGVQDISFEPTWAYDEVTLSEPIDLRLVAEMVGANLNDIRELNPSLLRNTTPKLPEFRLRLPLATRDIFLKRVAMVPPEKRVFWRWHTVRQGETLSGIAKQYKASVQSIAQVNSIDPNEPLREADDLVIPVGNLAPDREPTSLASRGSASGVHLVRRGDTLSLVARRYGLSTQALKDLNNLVDSTIRLGQKLRVRRQDPESSDLNREEVASSASPGTPPRKIASTGKPAETTGRLVHRVQKGDSLSRIASNYNTTVAVLRANNRHLKNSLQVGDTVYIPSDR